MVRLQLYPYGIFVDETNPRITTVTLGFDYAQWHNSIIATKLVPVPTPKCGVVCDVVSNAGPRFTCERGMFDCVIRALSPWQALNADPLN